MFGAVVPGFTAASSTVTTDSSPPVSVPAPTATPVAVATVAPVAVPAAAPDVAPVTASVTTPTVAPADAAGTSDATPDTASVLPVVAAEAAVAEFVSSALAFIGIATIAPVIANAATCTFKFFFFIFILPVFQKSFLNFPSVFFKALT